MGKIKTVKTISKRVRRTKGGKGKLVTRKAGKGHFNARESGKVTRNKRRDKGVKKTIQRNVDRAIQ